MLWPMRFHHGVYSPAEDWLFIRFLDGADIGRLLSAVTGTPSAAGWRRLFSKRS
jgi:hypothetical protein